MMEWMKQKMEQEEEKLYETYKLADGSSLVVNRLDGKTIYNVYHAKSTYPSAEMALYREQIRALIKKVTNQRKRIRDLTAANTVLRRNVKE